jgi:hypothetical protein
MNPSSPPDADRRELARAIGSLIWKNPALILDSVSRLRGSDTVIECRLRGGSMGAAIPSGSMLRIDLGRSGPYRVGEIIAFVRESGICVHRVAYLGRRERTRDFMVTQGDACFYPDPPVSTHAVLGAVTDFRCGDDWVATDMQVSAGRAGSITGKILLGLVAGLLELNVPVARGVAGALRIRKESATAAEA